MDGKISFAALKDEYDFSATVFAGKAGVATEIVYYMVRGIPVAKQEVEKVLRTLTERTGTVYSLQNVEVVLIEENTKEEKLQKRSETNKGMQKGKKNMSHYLTFRLNGSARTSRKVL